MTNYYKHLTAVILIALIGFLPMRAAITPQTTDPTNSDTYKGWVDNTDGHLSGATITGDVWSGDGADLPQARFVYINEANFPDDNFRNSFKTALHEQYYGGTKNPKFDDEFYFRSPVIRYNDNVPEASADNIFTDVELEGIDALCIERENAELYDLGNRLVAVGDLTGIELFVELKNLTVAFSGERCPVMSNKLENITLAHCNNLLEFDPSLYPNLKWLDLGFHQGSDALTSIDVSQNQALIGLRIMNCAALSEVNVSNLPTIEQIAISLNPSLQEIDLSDNVGLKRLNLAANNLQSLDVTHNTELEMLGCNRNQITDLDLSHNVKLFGIYVQNNKLTELDLSQLTLLGSVAPNEGSHELNYSEQYRTLQAEGIEIDGTKYYYFRLDDNQMTESEQPLVERMTATSFMNTPSRFVPENATWVSGGTIVNGTRGNLAPAEVDPGLFDGTILLLDPTSVENGVASGTATYTYDVNYSGTGADTQDVFTLNWTAEAEEVVTGIVNLSDDAQRGDVVAKRYYHIDGKASDAPFEGVNIVVTRYSDGSTTTQKVMR